MNFVRTRVGTPFARVVVQKEHDEGSLPTMPSGIAKLDSKGKSFDNDASLEILLSDSESTAECSKEVSLEEDEEDCSVGEEQYTPTRTFLHVLDSIFYGKVHKTVLLNASQLKEVHNAIATDYTRILLHEKSSSPTTAATCFHDLDLHIHSANHILDQFWQAQEMILQTSMAATAQETLFQEV